MAISSMKDIDFAQSLSIFCFGTLLYLSSVVIYRLYFHPLAKYPGPLLARLTDLHQGYHAWKGDRHLEFWRCHERYGDIVRFGPNSLSFNTSTTLKAIYGAKSNVRKGDAYTVFPIKKGAVSTFTAIDKVEHGRKRRVLSHALSDSAVKSMEKHILAHIRQFCANLGGTERAYSDEVEAKWSSAKNISNEADYLTFDVMGDLAFGKSFGMLESPDSRFALDLVAACARRNLICGSYPFLHTYGLDKVLFSRLVAMRQKFVRFAGIQAAERAKRGMDVDRKDFFHYLLEAKDPESGQGFSQPELWSESGTLIVAGSDTTSTVVAATIFYLLHNPQTREKVQQEVRGTFEDVEEIGIGAKLFGLHYLRACIDEAMRLSPPAPGLMPRQVLHGGLEIGGEWFPETTVVGVPHYAIHHNPEYYPRPFEYKPERWIAESEPNVTADSVASAQAAFCPFSVGPRGCIGKGMAYAELTMTLARVLYLYDMRLAPGSRLGEGSVDVGSGRQAGVEFQLKDIFTAEKDGPLVEFRGRSS